MFARVFLVAGLVCAAGVVSAETIQLKDQSSVSGKILAEKRDQVVVDLGFTVLTIPKNQIAKISKEVPVDPKKAGKATPKSATTATTEAPSAPAAAAGTRPFFQGAR